MTDTDEIFMEELKKEFKETVAGNLSEMASLYQEKNFEEISRIAHDIKGTSGIFGLDEGTEIARQLQYAAQNKETGKVMQLLEQLTDYMRKNEIIE